MNPVLWLTTSILLLASGIAQQTQAAVLLSHGVNTSLNPAVNVNLTQQGDIDWAIWNFTATGSPGAASPVAATNRKSGGTASISGISTVGTSAIGLRGSGVGSGGAQFFSYTDGSSPASLSSAQQSLIFANPLDTPNVGVSLSVAGNVGQIYTVYIWATGFDAQGTLTASLVGADTKTELSQVYSTTAPKSPTLFVFSFQPDNAADRLLLSYVMTNTGTSNTSSHVGIQAIAISAFPVPEPTRALLCLLSLIGLTQIRRRSR